jgi:hypothetical protein
MRKLTIHCVLVLVFFSVGSIVKGQSIPDTITAQQRIYAEIGGFTSSASQTPFWFRSRQYGIIPLSGPAGIVQIGATKQFGDWQNASKLHFKLGIEGVANVGTASRIILPVAYASLFTKNFELYGGRRREVFGLVDTLLTSGSYAWSGNALPIYKIQFGTRGYVPIGFTKGILALNGLYAHGWFSNTDSVQNSFLHQKALFARISLFHNRIKLYGGLTHYVQWGGRSNAIGVLAPHGRIPSSLKDYLNVVLVRSPPADTSQYSGFDSDNQVGNHLGSIDFALEVDNPKSNWYIYYQHAYDDKSGVAFQNMPDGLYGIRWKNKQTKFHSTFHIKQITTEFLTTLNQSGFDINIGDRQYYGADNYFNNLQFVDGWTHKQRIIGTPFLTRWLDSRADLNNIIGGFGKEMISNNRVQVLHLGLLAGKANGIETRLLLSWSKNFGRPVTLDPRMPLAQFSGLAELIAPISWLGNSQIRIAFTMDQGKWLTDNFGAWISIKKQWISK